MSMVRLERPQAPSVQVRRLEKDEAREKRVARKRRWMGVDGIIATEDCDLFVKKWSEVP